MHYLLLIGFALLSIVKAEAIPDIPESDRILITDLRLLGENFLDAFMKGEFDNKISFAQLIIDSQEAPQDVIDRMQGFIGRWQDKRSPLNETNLHKLSWEIGLAFSEESLFIHELTERANLYTMFKFDEFNSMYENNSSIRRNAFKNELIQKMNRISQATKESESDLMYAFRQFLNKKTLNPRLFYSLLIELRKY